MSRRRAVLVSAVASVSAFTCGAALAQKPAPGPGTSSKPIHLTREAAAGGAWGDTARSRARQGDCAGALDAFDAALKTNVNPELRRDRGLCHEQLGHPFPAIDDYRAYLKDRSNAPDADGIRERLARLEEQVGVGGKGERPAPAESAPAPAAGASASASISVGGGGVSAEASGGTTGGGKSRSQMEFESDEKLAAAASGSALRESRGWVLGAYLGVRQSQDLKPEIAGVSGSMSMGTNEAFGAAIRYSFGKVSSIVSELGYVTFNDSHIAGPGFFLGYEARLALTRFTSDAIILGAGLGYERYRSSDSGGVINSLLPRARLGYRHVFSDAIGLEIHGDGGLGKYWVNGASGMSIPMAAVFGGYLALVVGF